MKRIILALSIILSFQFPNHVFANSTSSTFQKLQLKQAFGQIPLSFESNQGQTDKSVRFFSRGNGYGFYLTPTEAVLVLSKQPEYSKSDPKIQSSIIRMQFVGANPEPRIVGEDKLTGKTNYFIGKDESKWRKGISNFKKARYQEIYPGIDLVFYGNQRKLEYDFVVKPGADPNLIQLSFEGADRLSIESGDLVLHTSGGDIFQKAPIIYQDIDGQRTMASGNYIFSENNQVAFYIGNHDSSSAIIIDPILIFSTFFGGSGNDIGVARQSF